MAVNLLKDIVTSNLEHLPNNPGWKGQKHVNKNYVAGGGSRGGGGGVFVFTTYGLFLPETLEGEMTIVLGNMSQQFQARESRQ